MRRFRVGDRVRFETDSTGKWPRWNWMEDSGSTKNFIEGIVVEVDEVGGCVTVDGMGNCWYWPQPDEEDSNYGSPGYLELVEAVEDLQKCKKCGGAGWVWGRELDDPSEDTYQDDMTKYSCDWCNRDDNEDQQHNGVELAPAITSEKQQETIRKLGIKKTDVDASLEPTKTMTVKEVEEMVMEILFRADRRFLRGAATADDSPLIRGDMVEKEHIEISKERAHAIAEALVGVKVTK